MPSKEEMLKVIYEEIADKTLSKWCLINNYRDSYRWNEEENLFVVSVWKNKLVCFNNTRYWQSWEEPMTWIHVINTKKERNTEEWWYEIIWHPVLIGDCLEWIYSVYVSKQSLDYWFTDAINILIWKWEKKMNSPIDEAPEAIEFMHQLVLDANQQDDD